MPGEQRWV
ncbi:hypothetical protein E2C01_084084 [Portunus trituberculatus]|uniref:Uncharacterized protein n=1 Tax=Portunus trituberculatus TaxID=210409 RepID=A0A5B7IUC8_PORTR|nr:hypothetical protein [Portunus trituberculatus]